MYVAHIQKSNILKFKITEKSLANKATLKYPNKYNYCTKIQITKTTLYILPHPYAHTPAQTQNTQNPPPHTDPPTLQVDENQLQLGATIIHWTNTANWPANPPFQRKMFGIQQ